MTKPVFIATILLAVSAVAIADVFLKRAALEGSFLGAVRNFWFLGAVALYLFQVAVFTWAFVSGWELSIVGILQTALYAVIVLGAGLLFFKEGLSAVQWIGVVLALSGAILLNFK